MGLSVFPPRIPLFISPCVLSTLSKVVKRFLHFESQCIEPAVWLLGPLLAMVLLFSAVLLRQLHHFYDEGNSETLVLSLP